MGHDEFLFRACLRARLEADFVTSRWKDSYEFPDEVVLIIIEGWSTKACSVELRGQI